VIANFGTYLKKLFNTDFFKNSLILIIGTGIAQTIPIAMQLYLRRVYAPEDFGAFSVYMNILGILAIIVTLRYEIAIVLPETNSKAANLLGLTMGFSLIINFLLAFVFIVFHYPIIRLLNLPDKYGVFLYFIPLGVFMFSSYQAINYYLIRIKAFKASSINKISRRVTEGVVQVLFGIAKLPIGLVLADLSGNVANNLSGINQIVKKGGDLRSISVKRMLSVCKEYIHFPKYNLLPAVLDSITLALPIFFINKFFSAKYAGYVDLTKLAIVVPLSLISTAISQVLLQKISERRKANQKILGDIFRLSIILFTISIAVLLIIQFWSANLFQLVFGEKWALSGQIAKILVFSYTIRFIVSPLSIVFLALEKIKVQAFWQITYFLLIGSLIFFSDFEFQRFLRLFVILEVISYVLYYSIIIKVSRDYDKNIINYDYRQS